MDVASVEQTSADDLRRTAMRLAVEVVKAAYEEALTQHGMLRSTVTLISTYAQANLDALQEQGGPVDPSGRAAFPSESQHPATRPPGGSKARQPAALAQWRSTAMGKHGDKDNPKDDPKGGDGSSPQGGKRGSGGDGGGNKGDGKNPK